jgi:hypothetical protein
MTQSPPDIMTLALKVAETLDARRIAEMAVLNAHQLNMDRSSPRWHDLMIRERNARVANDQALHDYRAAKCS